MSIIAYTGLPRHGKSYSAIREVILPALMQSPPREVWTNIPIRNEQDWLERCGGVPTVFATADVLDNPRWFTEVLPAGALLVLDECWRVWPSGMKANNANPEHMEFLAMHGHNVGEAGYTTEIVLVTQNLSQIAAFARDLVEYTYRTVKLSHVGSDRRFRFDCFQGAVTGVNPPKSRLISQQFYTYDRDIFELYVSHTKSSTGDAGVEKKVDPRSTMLSWRRFRWWALGGAVALLFCIWAVRHLMAAYGFGAGEESLPAQSAPAPRPAPQPPQPRFIDHFRDHDIYIIYNNHSSGRTYYRFLAETRHGVVELTQADLLRLSYTVRPVTQCAAFLEIGGRNRLVTCRAPEDPAADVVSVDSWIPGRSGSGS